MPGMMDTILNLGLNDATEPGWRPRRATRTSPATAASASRESSATIVGVGRGPRRPVAPAAAAPSRPSSAPGTATVRGRTARRRGSATTWAPASPSRRWSSATAAGTPATGVLFTRNPATGERALYGDVLFDAQGEDVVAGTHATEPIAVLDERMPGVAAELRDPTRTASSATTRTVRHRVHDRARAAVDAPGPRRQAEPAGRAPDRGRHGRGPVVPADPRGGRAPRRPAARRPADGRRGAVRGRVPPLVTGLRRLAGRRLAARSAIDARRRGRGGRARAPTSSSSARRRRPTTSTAWRAAGHPHVPGGLASHAAVVARGWGIPAVVGASDVVVGADGVTIGGRTLGAGDGDHDRRRPRARCSRAHIAGTVTVVPEAAILLGWAAELGIEVPRPAATPTSARPTAEPPRRRRSPPSATADDAVRALAIKGFAATRRARDRAGHGRGDVHGPPRPARRRRPRGAGRRVVPPDRPRARSTAGRCSPPSRRVGPRSRARGPRRVPRPRPPHEGHRHRVADPRDRRRPGAQRPRGRGLRRGGPRPPRRAARGRRRLARRPRRGARADAPVRGPARRGPRRRRQAAMAGSSPHRGSTATTASGSSSTRT